MQKYKVGIIGLGYVGTACELGFAAIPNVDVRCYDKYKDTESLDTCVSHSKILFICLPTPVADDGSCNTSIIKSVVSQIDSRTRDRKIFVIKSTVPPGTTDELMTDCPNHSFVFNPEFLTQKRFIQDFIEQKHIFLGHCIGTNGVPYELCNLYLDFIRHHKNKAAIHTCFAKEAEMLKYATNCYLAQKVTYFNEVSEICKATSIDYDKVKNLLLNDDRIGKTHMDVPGSDSQFGFGGACFPKDIQALIAYAHENNVDPLLLESTWAKNCLIREKHEWNELAQVNGNYKKMA
jgi:nucleotide sugar dehydrogenase